MTSSTNAERTPAPQERAAVYAGTPTRELVLPGRGPSFVLLHGFGDSLDTWRPLMAQLAVRGAAAVAVDLPGFGAADPPPPGPRLDHLDRFVADVVSRNSAHGAPVLVGNSLGACLTVRAASLGVPLRAAVPLAAPGDEFPRFARALILSDSASPAARAGRAALSWLPVPGALRARAVRRGAERLIFHDPARVDPVAVQRLVDQFSTGRDARRILQLLRRMLTEHAEAGYRTERIGAPLLLVHGARDALLPVGNSVRLHAAVPGSRLEILPGCGHCPQLEMPARVAELLVTFVTDAG